ncbi:hypothetical protein BOX15_Mlig010979g2 [Macrostomum lignano]|uniref:Uncharacterized protein n=2 Tax=Macrostomum lignano TaxID=282301 RepID=A0A1I8GED0_9PLAT|nr:hypothetical protein BOX15_Mlig001831g3 [Macrostomum lignano]PAA57937.1 hypothetical protein BOX15_Mlig010979g2 [Macrostomum lignano]
MTRYIVFFIEDSQIVERSEEEVKLDSEYSSFASEDWTALNDSNRYSLSPIHVRAEYQGEWYDAVVLQVLLDPETDSDPTVYMLRQMVAEKKKRLESLLKTIARVNIGRRNNFPPLNMVNTSDSETDIGRVAQKEQRQPLTSRGSRPRLPQISEFVPTTTPPQRQDLRAAVREAQKNVCLEESTPRSSATASANQISTVPKTPELPVAHNTAPLVDQQHSAVDLSHQPSDLEETIISPALIRGIQKQLADAGINPESLTAVAHLAMLDTRQQRAVESRIRRFEDSITTAIEGLVAQVASLERRINQQQVPAAAGGPRQNWKTIDSWPLYIRFITSPSFRNELAPSLRGCRCASVHDTCLRMLSKCLSDAMQQVVNWSGRNMAERCKSELPSIEVTDSALAFKNAMDVFQDAIVLIYPDEKSRPSEQAVEKEMARILKHAAERCAARRKRLSLPVSAAAAEFSHQARRPRLLSSSSDE